MFNLFRRKNTLKDWELLLLTETILLLPNKYHYLLEQLSSGLLRYSIEGFTSNDVSFIFNPDL